jgi:hypothetical protein
MKNIFFLGVMSVLLSCGSSKSNAPALSSSEQLEYSMKRDQSKYVCPMKECKNGFSQLAGACPDCKMDLVVNKNYVEVK